MNYILTTVFLLFPLHSLVPGMFATSAVDKTVTLWDTTNGGTPRARLNKDMKVGKLFTVNFYPSSPWLLGCGGGGKEIAIWDMKEDSTVQKCFGGRAILNASTSGAVETGTAEPTESILDSVMTPDSKSTDAKVEKKSSNKKKKNKKKKVHRAGR